MNSIDPRTSLLTLASKLGPDVGYNKTALQSLRILRSESILEDVPVLYRPGAVFVLQGSKRGFLDNNVYRYDADHFLAVSVPVPFRMASKASPEHPLLAIYVDFDLQLAAEIVTTLDRHSNRTNLTMAKSLISSPMTPTLFDVLHRLLQALCDPQEFAVIGAGLLKELHYRILIGPQAAPLMAALRRGGKDARLIQSLTLIRERFCEGLSVSELAVAAGMSVPSYHAHFKFLTGNTPINYIKALRLHEARLMIARRKGPIADIAVDIGYASPAQFSRDFKRHFCRTPSEESKWVREHLGETR